MPRQVVGFVCDMCHTLWETQELADRCEANHHHAEFVGFEWERGKNAPEAVVVRITRPNGEVVELKYY